MQQNSTTRPTAAVVPAAGFGTRLRPLSDAIPKEMLPVGRQLALERIVAELLAAGMTQVVFVLSPAKEAQIKRHFGEGRDSAAFSYVIQPEMRGLGDAILRAAPLLESEAAPFVVALGDAVFEEPEPGGLTRRLVESFMGASASVGLAVQRVPRERISRYGVVTPAAAVDPSADFVQITDIVEKPAPEDAPSDLAAAARYVVGAEVFAVLRETAPGKGGEIQLTDALRMLLHRGKPGVAVPLRMNEIRHDLGGLDSYFRAFAAFALSDAEHGASLRAYLSEKLAAAAPAQVP